MVFMWRHNPGSAILTRCPGWLGDVFLVRGFISNKLALAPAEWSEYHGGSMFELGSHWWTPPCACSADPRP